MNRIEEKFKELRRQRKKAFISYICAGDPDLGTTGKLVLELENAGVDIIELGIPFSDPLADGPTIQRASQRALKKRVNIPKILAMVRSLRRNTQIPLVFMTYYNLVYDYGVERFVKDSKAAGADGVIIPDLIPEEADELVSASKKHAFDTIFLIAPTSTPNRIRMIAKRSTGFIYYVSLTGVTGARSSLPAKVKEHIRSIKRITKKPVCVGFGVSTRRQVKDLARFSDGIIVGSAIINRIEEGLKDRKALPKKIAGFVKGLIRG